MNVRLLTSNKSVTCSQNQSQSILSITTSHTGNYWHPTLPFLSIALLSMQMISLPRQSDSFLSKEIHHQISTSLFIFNSLFRKIKTLKQTFKGQTPLPPTQQTPSSLPSDFFFHHSYAHYVKSILFLLFCEKGFSIKDKQHRQKRLL